jgi:hypothetical protein
MTHLHRQAMSAAEARRSGGDDETAVSSASKAK